MPICSCFCPSIRPHFQRAHCGSLVSASRSSWFSDTITEQLCAVSRELLPLDSGHFFPFFLIFLLFFFSPPGLVQTVFTCGQGFSLQSTWSSSLPGHRAGVTATWTIRVMELIPHSSLKSSIHPSGQKKLDALGCANISV